MSTDILSTIKDIICENEDIDPASISESSSLEADLGMDDLGITTLCLSVEEEWDIVLDDDAPDGWLTVADVVASVEKGLMV